MPNLLMEPKPKVLSRIETAIIQKLGPEVKLNEEEFEVILLDGTQLVELTEEDKAYLEKFKNAHTLSMSYCGLKSLKNLPVLPNVESVDLSDNCLLGDDLGAINQSFKRIKQLLLGNNSIRDRDLSHISSLGKCQHLTALDLSANPLTDMQAYRENVFEKLGHLEALDGFDKDGNEWSIDSGKEMREDEDYLHDNQIMGEDGFFYTTETMKMRVGSDDESSHSEHSEQSGNSGRRYSSDQ